MSSVMQGAVKDEFVTSLAVLILNDSNIVPSVDNINALLNSSNNVVAPHWPNLFAQFLSNRSTGSLLDGVQVGGGGNVQAVPPVIAAKEEKMSFRNLPLTSLTVSGEFYDCLGEVTIKQTWVNCIFHPITTRYSFALDTNAVVSGFRMKIGSNNWKGVVKEKSTARAEYKAAVDSGLKSSLLEKVGSGTYTVRIGPIDVNETVEIEFTYLTRTEVRQEDGVYMFTMPTNIAPKYCSPNHGSLSELTYLGETFEIPSCYSPGYDFKVDIRWNSGSVIQECNTTPVNGDFTLCVKTDSTIAAYSYESPEDQSTFLYIHNRIPSEVTAAVPRKITILLDRSGSMGGSKIQQALVAIESFLGLIDSSNYFNLVSFGSDHQALWSHPCLATEANKNECITALRRYNADMGGTELYHCLERVVGEDIQRFAVKKDSSNARDYKELEHIVVLLTDGQVSDIQQITSMLQSKAQRCRVMTIGIGSDADRKLVQRVAEVTHGISRMLVDAFDLTAALTDIVDYIHKQYYVNVCVDRYEAVQCSKVLYPAHPLDMFVRLSPEELSDLASSGLTITAEDPVHKIEKVWFIPIKSCVRCSQLIEKLHANSVIRQLEERLDFVLHNTDRLELTSQIIALSVKYSIMNSLTSFLVVSDMQSVSLAVEDVVIPHHYGSSSGAAACGGAVSVQYAKESYDDCDEEEVDALEGGMDMFGGSSGGHWETTLVGPTLDLGVVINEVGVDGALKFTTNERICELLKGCYADVNDLIDDARSVNLSVLDYFHVFILVHAKFIKLTTHRELNQLTVNLTRYVESKFGLNGFAVQFSAVESLYKVKFVTSQRNYVSSGGGDY